MLDICREMCRFLKSLPWHFHCWYVVHDLGQDSDVILTLYALPAVDAFHSKEIRMASGCDGYHFSVCLLKGASSYCVGFIVYWEAVFVHVLQFLEFTLVNYVYKICSFGKNFKSQQYGNFAKYELYLITVVSCRNKRQLEVEITDILNFSPDKCCHGYCQIGFL